jgi:gluconokinase
VTASSAPAVSSLAIVFMGVAGCGKSAVGGGVGTALGLRLIEGDDFHSASNRDKMHRGIPLTDEDRAGWLEALGRELENTSEGIALTCSALKRAYRDVFRRHRPDVRFVFLDIDRETAQRRVAGRGATHFFSPTLVDSQFATLERPDDEPGVLRVDATAAIPELVRRIVRWIGDTAPHANG